MLAQLFWLWKQSDNLLSNHLRYDDFYYDIAEGGIGKGMYVFDFNHVLVNAFI